MGETKVCKCSVCGRLYGASLYHLTAKESREHTVSPCGHSREHIIPIEPIERPIKK